MIRPLAALAALLLSGCATTPEVTLLFGPSYNNQTDGSELGATLILLQQIGATRIRCGWMHSSTLNNGPPFYPDRDEVTIDQSGCGPRWGGKPR